MRVPFRRVRKRRISRPLTWPACSAASCAAGRRHRSATAISARWFRLAATSAVGNLMGGLIGGSVFIDGLIARFMYKSLYQMHQLALHGLVKTSLDVIANQLRKATQAAHQAALGPVHAMNPGGGPIVQKTCIFAIWALLLPQT